MKFRGLFLISSVWKFAGRAHWMSLGASCAQGQRGGTGEGAGGFHVPDLHSLTPIHLGDQDFVSISWYLQILSGVGQPLGRSCRSLEMIFINRWSLSVSFNTTSKGMTDPDCYKYMMPVSLNGFFHKPVFRVDINELLSFFQELDIKNYMAALGYVIQSQGRCETVL